MVAFLIVVIDGRVWCQKPWRKDFLTTFLFGLSGRWFIWTRGDCVNSSLWIMHLNLELLTVCPAHVSKILETICLL